MFVTVNCIATELQLKFVSPSYLDPNQEAVTGIGMKKNSEIALKISSFEMNCENLPSKCKLEFQFHVYNCKTYEFVYERIVNNDLVMQKQALQIKFKFIAAQELFLLVS